MKPIKIQTKERILNITAVLLYEKGFQSVNVDEIASLSGITKMTLYRHFFSKDQLVGEAIKHTEKLWWDWFITKIRQRAKIPEKQLLAIFDIFLEGVKPDSSYECEFFVKTKICVLGRMYPIFLVSTDFYKCLHGFILETTKLAEYSTPIQITEQFMILITGINVLCNFEDAQRIKIVQTAKDIAAIIIKSNQKGSLH